MTRLSRIALVLLVGVLVGSALSGSEERTISAVGTGILLTTQALPQVS